MFLAVVTLHELHISESHENQMPMRLATTTNSETRVWQKVMAGVETHAFHLSEKPES